MSRATCIAALKAEDIELDDTQLNAIADSVETTIANAKAQGVNVFDAIQKSLDDWADNADAFMDVVKRNKHLNFVARTNMQAYIDEHWADAPHEGLRTLLTGTQANRPGAKDAVAVLQHQLSDKYIGQLTSRLSVVGSDGRKPMDFVKGKLIGGKNEHEDDVFRIMYHMNQPEPDISQWSGKPSMVQAARILLDAQEVSRKDANEAGSHHIAALENRVIRRTHDMFKMKEHGFDAWKKDMEEFGVLDNSDFPIEKWDDIALRHFNQTVSGQRVINPEGHPEISSIPGGMGNLSKEMAHARVFTFRDVEAELAYFKKYGKGNLLENVVFSLELTAQRTGLMRRFGPNAKANFKAVEQNIAYKLSKGDDPVKLQKFEQRMKTINKMHWPMVDGSLFVPGNAAGAKIGQTYRAVKMMALLGKAVLTSIVDVPIAASEVRYHGGSYLGGMLETINSVSHGRTPAEKEILNGLGVVADNARNSVVARFSPDYNEAGAQARMTELYFNLNLLTPWTDRIGTGFALARSHSLAGYKKLRFDKLSPEWQRVLTQFNIEQAEWDVIRHGSLKEADGRQYITPESIAELDDNVISRYLVTKNLQVNKSNLTKYRTELADRFRNYFYSRAHTAALEPDAGTRAMVLMGFPAGTPEGELVRAVGLFKSFPAAYVRQVMGRDVRGHRSDLPGNIQALADPTAMANMIRLTSMTTLFGAMSIYIKDLTDLKKTPEITGDNFGAFLLRSMLAGGALSLYGDFLLGEAKNRYGGNALTTFLGPAAQDIVTIDTIREKLFSTDPEIQDAGADALNWIFRNVPGSNLFYTKAAYDYGVIYNLMEMSDPGSLQRMEAAKMRQTQTEFMYPPSTVIPNF